MMTVESGRSTHRDTQVPLSQTCLHTRSALAACESTNHTAAVRTPIRILLMFSSPRSPHVQLHGRLLVPSSRRPSPTARSTYWEWNSRTLSLGAEQQNALGVYRTFIWDNLVRGSRRQAMRIARLNEFACSGSFHGVGAAWLFRNDGDGLDRPDDAAQRSSLDLFPNDEKAALSDAACGGDRDSADPRPRWTRRQTCQQARRARVPRSGSRSSFNPTVGAVCRNQARGSRRQSEAPARGALSATADRTGSRARTVRRFNSFGLCARAGARPGHCRGLGIV